jgi:hypothetical protein
MTNKPKPILFGERFPDIDDCDVCGRCWVSYSLSALDLEPDQEHPDVCDDIEQWELCTPRNFSWQGLKNAKCWLPFDDLPLP